MDPCWLTNMAARQPRWMAGAKPPYLGKTWPGSKEAPEGSLLQQWQRERTQREGWGRGTDSKAVTVTVRCCAKERPSPTAQDEHRPHPLDA